MQIDYNAAPYIPAALSHSTSAPLCPRPLHIIVSSGRFIQLTPEYRRPEAEVIVQSLWGGLGTLEGMWQWGTHTEVSLFTSPQCSPTQGQIL